MTTINALMDRGASSQYCAGFLFMTVSIVLILMSLLHLVSADSPFVSYKPSSAALTAAMVLSFKSSLLKMCSICTLTVPGAMPNVSAISELV